MARIPARRRNGEHDDCELPTIDVDALIPRPKLLRARGCVFAQRGLLAFAAPCVQTDAMSRAVHAVFPRAPRVQPQLGECLTTPVVSPVCALTHVARLFTRRDDDAPEDAARRLARFQRLLETLMLHAIVYEAAQLVLDADALCGPHDDPAAYIACLETWAAFAPRPVVLIEHARPPAVGAR